MAASGAIAETPTHPIETIPLEQGWGDELRQLYYFTPQGSLLIPLPWLMALERADGPGRFADPDHLAAFGWIYDAGARQDLNPAGLPIGFAIDPAPRPEGRWAGFTCAACHSSEIDLGNVRVRVDGAPSHLDADRFYAALADAVRATVLDPARFAGFAAAVLGAEATAADQAALHARLAAYEVRLSGDAAIRQSAVAAGFGRVDALNQITNALAFRDLGMTENLRAAVAPVSYPYLWATPQSDWVQWNPVASGPLGRNVGEVLGVFGAADLRSDSPLMFGSTALLPQLILLEDWIEDLRSPRWPDAYLDPVDADLAETGRTLFQQDCSGCHNMPPWRMTDPAENLLGKQFIRVGRIPAAAVGTDPAYLRSFLGRTTATGPLAPLFGNKPVVPGAQFFTTVIGAVVERALAETPMTSEQFLAANGYRFMASEPGAPLKRYNPASAPCETLNCLKASPLLGIWATGPYLHNGSVPTVYELLSPPSERRAVFWTGGRKLDAERLGFVSDEAPGLFRFDTALPGNGNGGHVFPPTGYSHEERVAVIEYLKDPNRFAPEPHR